MKLAIIGSGPLALYCAHHFDLIGAEVTLFQRSPLGGNIRFLQDFFPQVNILVNEENKTLESFWENELCELIKEVETKQLTKAGEVLRVHKRFLHLPESIPNRTRLHDLFRVIYSVNPREAILKQLEENPDMFNQLGEQVISSLHTPVESFEDFDIVIDARGLGKKPQPMGPSHSAALNENNIKLSAPIFYEKEIFTSLEFHNKKQIIIVGDTETSVLALLKCRDWLFSRPDHSISWVTHSPINKPFLNPWFNHELISLLSEIEKQFEEAKLIFEEKMHQWRDLEDYIKVKIPKPIEPEPKIKIFQGYDVTSVDKLLDRDGVFATIETPDFREFSNSNLDLKTLAADAILVACGYEEDCHFANGIQDEEPGYYKLGATNLSEGLFQIKIIEKKIMSFFSRAT